MAIIHMPSDASPEKGAGLIGLQVVGEREEISRIPRDAHIVMVRPDPTGLDVKAKVSMS